MIQALRRFLKENDVMAYLTMMANRLLELHRVLRPTGSLFLHCDPTASHYLKIVLDAVFGSENFRNEITWKRTSAHSDSKTLGNAHDILFFYTKTDKFVWNKQYQAYNEDYVKSHYRYRDNAGRQYRTDNLRYGVVLKRECKSFMKAGDCIIRSLEV
jgi:site-specific DNA-methyltransferase (adenine-specific)